MQGRVVDRGELSADQSQRQGRIRCSSFEMGPDRLETRVGARGSRRDPLRAIIAVDAPSSWLRLLIRLGYH